MEPAIETGHASNPKPPLAPKPRLTPKPFSLQKNNAFRSIHAPKTIGTSSKPTTNQTGKDEATGVPKPTPTARVQQTTIADSKPSSVRKPVKDKLKTTQESKASPHEVVVGSSGGAPGKSDPPLKTAPPEETPKSVSIQKDDVTQTNHKAATDDLISNSEQKDGKKKEDETQSSVTQKPEEPGSDNGSSTTGPTYQWGGTRKSLSTELTSMFESGGPALPVQPITTVSTNNTNCDSTNSVSPNPEQSQTTTEPSNRESDVTGYEDDYIGGGSIKRRISLLFDSSSRPEVMAKKEEPEIVTSEGGVKERIKHWAMETSSEGPKTERKPQAATRSRSKSFEPVLAPAAEKTSKTPQVKPPATETSSTHTVDPHPKMSSPEPPSESPIETSKDSSPEMMSLSKEDKPTNPTKDEARLCSRSLPATQAATNEGDSSKSGQRSLRRDNVKRRSVRFGIVERDDGGPPLILGSASESSSEEEEEAPHNKSEEDIPVSFPVYRRAGDRQNKDDETQKLEEEQLKHLEFEQRRRAEEHEQARLKLEEEEEERKREEEEREKEHLRLREEEKHREEEREIERLAEEEMERLRKEELERERLKLEESEMRRQREEEMERERQLELMLQRQREDERERTRQREEKLKQEQIEREKERLEEERRREERLMVERERQRLREEEERSMNEHKEHIERLREEEMNLRAEEEERDREREFERVRQKEERLKQEEMEKERLREEAEEQQRRKKVEEMMRERLRQEEEEERKRRAYEREMQQEEEEERERLRQIEKQREEERVRHTERERLLEVERKMQAELEIQRVKELEEKLRRDQEKEKEILGLSDRGQKSKSDESSLISFDSEDVPQTSETPHSPFPKLSKPTENPIEVVYDDFSVKKSLIEVDFDDFSVKPKKWGSQAKAETPPVIDSWATSPWDGGKVDVLVPLDVSPQENRAPRYVAEPDDPEPTRAVESPEERQEDEEEEEEKEDVGEEEEEEKPEEKTEERQLISLEYEEAENKEDIEMEEEMDEVEEEEEDDDNDKQETLVDYHHSNGEDRDVDTLVDSEPDEQTPEPDSPPLIYDQVPEVSPRDVNTTNFHREPEFAPFPESSTPLLDTSAQRSKATLSKRRGRSRPSRSLRAGFAQREILDWRSRDSTDENESSSKQRESDSEEEQPKPKNIYPPSSSSQRVPIFPGLSPTALIAQLKKRTAGGGEETEDKGSRLEEKAPSPSLLSRSPRSAAHLAGAARVLPPLGGTDGGASSSPAWLKELKSKKRLGLHDSEA